MWLCKHLIPEFRKQKQTELCKFKVALIYIENIMSSSKRDRDRQKEGDRETETGRQRQRDTDRQTETETGRQTETKEASSPLWKVFYLCKRYSSKLTGKAHCGFLSTS